MEPALLRRIDALVAKKMFGSRSEAIQTAVSEKLQRLNRTRLARECTKLARKQEQRLADQGLAADLKEWPEY